MNKRKKKKALKDKKLEFLERHRVRAERYNCFGSLKDSCLTWDDWKKVKDKWGCCLKCGLITPKLHCDHIVPLSMGGPNSIENIQPLCEECNMSKFTDAVDYRPGVNNERLMFLFPELVTRRGEWVEINSKFRATCRKCWKNIEQGERIRYWTNVKKSEHIDCLVRPQPKAIKSLSLSKCSVCKEYISRRGKCNC